MLYLSAVHSEDRELYIEQTLIVKSKKDIALFAHKNAVEIEGDLIINASSLRDLHAFSVVTRIFGNLIIKNNTSLKEISHFTHLTEVEGEIIIENNAAILQIKPFTALESTAGLTVKNNKKLREIVFAKHIRSLEGDFVISGNPELTTISGSDKIDTILNDLSIINNQKLISINFLKSLRLINGNLTIENNKKLITISFNNLKSIGVNLFISHNNTLNNILLDKLETIGSLAASAKLSLIKNPQLVSVKLNALKPLHNVEINTPDNPKLSKNSVKKLINLTPEHMKYLNEIDN